MKELKPETAGNAPEPWMRNAAAEFTALSVGGELYPTPKAAGRLTEIIAKHYAASSQEATTPSERMSAEQFWEIYWTGERLSEWVTKADHVEQLKALQTGFAEAYAEHCIASALSSLQSKERETRNSTLDEVISLLRTRADDFFADTHPDAGEYTKGVVGAIFAQLRRFADELEKRRTP